MKNEKALVRFGVVTLLFAGLSASACGGPSTTFISSWRSPKAEPLAMRGEPVVAVVMMQNEITRKSAEDAHIQTMPKRKRLKAFKRRPPRVRCHAADSAQGRRQVDGKNVFRLQDCRDTALASERRQRKPECHTLRLACHCAARDQGPSVVDPGRDEGMRGQLHSLRQHRSPARWTYGDEVVAPHQGISL